MPAFEYLETDTTEPTAEQPARNAECLIKGHFDEGQPENLTLELDIRSDGHRYFLKYLVTEDDTGFVFRLIRTGEPITDYSLCIARKVGVAIAKAAIECYLEPRDNWYGFYECMKRKAPDLGVRGARALITCVWGIVGLDWD